MRKSDSGTEWLRLWDERGFAVRRVLGETTPPGTVVPLRVDPYVLPGACVMTFEPRGNRSEWLSITLGLTQPLDTRQRANGWEFCVRSPDPSPWVQQLLYDLTTYYLSEAGQVERGLYLPLAFFRNSFGELCAGLTDDRASLDILGEVSGLYLWSDYERLKFEVSSGPFGLLTAIAVTSDEDRLAQQMTPPHLLLLLRQMGVGQLTDPDRQSVLQMSSARERWESIRQMPHDDVVQLLDQREL